MKRIRKRRKTSETGNFFTRINRSFPLEEEKIQETSSEAPLAYFYVLLAENGKSAFCGPCGMGRPAATERLSPLYRASQT